MVITPISAVSLLMLLTTVVFLELMPPCLPTVRKRSKWYLLSSNAGVSFVTVTLQVAVKPPSSVLAVIVAVPSATAVTTPLSTVATLSSELLHVTVATVALDGTTAAVNVPVVPSFNSNVSGPTETPVTGTTSTLSSSSQAVNAKEVRATMNANNANLIFFISLCF